ASISSCVREYRCVAELTMSVRFLRPLSRSARISTLGKPAPPKPVMNTLAPSATSASACAADVTRLSIAMVCLPAPNSSTRRPATDPGSRATLRRAAVGPRLAANLRPWPPSHAGAKREDGRKRNAPSRAPRFRRRVAGHRFGTRRLAQATSWPEKPVKLILPYAPGGATDLIDRPWADKLSQVMGQQFVIENRGGAGVMIGTEAAAKAPADGYTPSCSRPMPPCRSCRACER